MAEGVWMDLIEVKITLNWINKCVKRALIPSIWYVAITMKFLIIFYEIIITSICICISNLLSRLASFRIVSFIINSSIDFKRFNKKLIQSEFIINYKTIKTNISSLFLVIKLLLTLTSNLIMQKIFLGHFIYLIDQFMHTHTTRWEL